MIIKAGICVAYDWKLLTYSLPKLYPVAEKICLSLDCERKSWNGNTFELDYTSFLSFIKMIDRENKIQLVEESFYNSNKTPIENECYQRKRMAEVLGKADWIIQLDADEILIDPKRFKLELEKHKQERPVNIHGIWINLIKKTETGYVYSVFRTPPLATNSPEYEYGRTNGHFNLVTNTFLAHITWARPEEEVFYKLRNWGHSHEFNGMSFYKMWKALDDFNWIYLKDFHPMNKNEIPKLYFQKAESIEAFIQQFDSNHHMLTRKEKLFNNIWASRFKQLIRMAIHK